MPGSSFTRWSIRVGALLALVGLALDLAGLALGTHRLDGPSWTLSATAAGVLIALAMFDAVDSLEERRAERELANLPTEVSLRLVGDMPHALVRRVGGELYMIGLPDGYDPRDDDGRWIAHALAEGNPALEAVFVQAFRAMIDDDDPGDE